MFQFILLLGLLLNSFTVYSANIFEAPAPDENPGIHIQGKIEKGDYEKFKKAARQLSKKNTPIELVLNSAGGDFVEAIKIGRLVRQLHARTVSHGVISTHKNTDIVKCYSSCFIIFVSGSERDPEDNLFLLSGQPEVNIPVLGLHRPYVAPEIYANYSIEKANKIYSNIESITRNYLYGLNIETSLIDKMFKTSSKNIEYINRSEFRQKIGYKVAFFEEWKMAKCGYLNKAEVDNLGEILSERIMRQDESFVPKWMTLKYANKLLSKDQKISSCINEELLKHQRLVLDL